TQSSFRRTPFPASEHVLLLYPFFFSSRRRHTRSLRDWSSDVCSSDLFPVEEDDAQVRDRTASQDVQDLRREDLLDAPPCLGARRSEERRVGKECRSGWASEHSKREIRGGDSGRACRREVCE